MGSKSVSKPCLSLDSQSLKIANLHYDIVVTRLSQTLRMFHLSPSDFILNSKSPFQLGVVNVDSKLRAINIFRLRMGGQSASQPLFQFQHLSLDITRRYTFHFVAWHFFMYFTLVPLIHVVLNKTLDF